MNIEHSDFIGVYDNALSEQFCDNMIDYYEWAAKNNKTWGRPEQETLKKDDSTTLNPGNFEEISFSSDNLGNFITEFNDVFWNQCWEDYSNTYSVLKNYNRHTIFTYKVQKTLPAGGYHIWHCENSESYFRSRIAAYTLYLNDVEEGGETEFLYCSRRVSAKKGRLAIFPSNYPWAHRGNPPLSGEKYIMTGWIEFC
jgi:hypothetical protein